MSDAVETLRGLENLLVLIAGERTGEQTWLFDDAVQEARLAAWERLDQGHPQGIALRGARQAVTDVVRGRRMTGSKQRNLPLAPRTIPLLVETDDSEALVVEPADPGALAAFAETEMREVLASALDQRDQEIVRLTYWEGRERSEVGAAMGITPQGVSYRLKSIHKRLKEALS